MGQSLQQQYNTGGPMIDEAKEPAAPTTTAPDAAPPERKMNIIVLPRLREFDALEPPVEIDPAQEIEFLLKQHHSLTVEVADATHWAKSAAAVKKNAEARVDHLELLIQARLKAIVLKLRKSKTSKYVDISLETAGAPDLMKRIQLRAQQAIIAIDDEAKVIDHFTKDALPTDAKAGPCTLIPRHWEIGKADLNKHMKDLPDGSKIPGISIEERDDKAYINNPPKAKKPKDDEEAEGGS